MKNMNLYERKPLKYYQKLYEDEHNDQPMANINYNKVESKVPSSMIKTETNNKTKHCMKQCFVEVRSPFVQMHLPKHSQASAKDGYLTWSMNSSISKHD